MSCFVNSQIEVSSLLSTISLLSSFKEPIRLTPPANIEPIAIKVKVISCTWSGSNLDNIAKPL